MREIKFRALTKEGDWRYGVPIDSGKWMYENPEIGAYGVMPETVGQFTGLHDKNGKEIYEGDIVNVRRSSRVEPHEVKFDGGMFWAGYHNGSSTRTRKKALQPKLVEVIGNIHEKESPNEQ